MRVGILSRLDMPEAIKLADKLYHLLASEYDVCLDESLLAYIDGERISGCDVLLTIGGDGTILFAVRRYNLPILGINMGRHGFLCEIGPHEISIIPDILENHRVEERTKLEVSGIGEALNEAVIRGMMPTKPARYTVEWDGKEDYSGDGLIVATPTGSTAYSLAAGGPVVPHNAPVFILTPICPIERRHRPIVFRDDATMRISVRKERSFLALDGVLKKEMDVGEGFEIRKSKNRAIFWRRG